MRINKFRLIVNWIFDEFFATFHVSTDKRVLNSIFFFFFYINISWPMVVWKCWLDKWFHILMIYLYSSLLDANLLESSSSALQHFLFSIYVNIFSNLIIIKNKSVIIRTFSFFYIDIFFWLFRESMAICCSRWNSYYMIYIDICFNILLLFESNIFKPISFWNVKHFLHSSHIFAFEYLKVWISSMLVTLKIDDIY